MAEEKKKDEFKSTSIGKPESPVAPSDVDALIEETLKEVPKEEKKEVKATPKEEPGFKATPFEVKKEEKVLEKAAPVKTEAPGKKIEPKYEATFKQYKVDDIVDGTVVKVDPSGILVDIGYKAEGLILPEEVSEKISGAATEELKVGDKIKVYIENLENKEGYVVLSKKRADHEYKWRKAYEAYKARKVLDAKVTGAVKGGLIVDCDGIKGFIPASQVAKKADTPLDQFKDQVLPIKIIHIDRRQGKIVLSHKLAAGEKQKYQLDKIFDEIEVGQIRKGTVTSIKSFGAFVDLGGIEGLIHLTELSWKRVNHPSEVLKIGDEIDVFVLGVDKVKKKIALGLKELQPDPWVQATELYKVGDIVKGKVVKLVKFGAFIELEKGLEGLCHISELSAKPVHRPEDAVKTGDEVTVKILRVLPDEQKIGLSIKEIQLDKEREEIRKQKEKEAEESKVTIGDIVKEKEKKEGGKKGKSSQK